VTWAALIIVLTTPAVYCVVRFSLCSDWGALAALVAAVAWVRFLLATML